MPNDGELIYYPYRGIIEEYRELPGHKPPDEFIVERDEPKKMHRIYETDGIRRHVKPGEHFSDTLDNPIVFNPINCNPTATKYLVWKEVERPSSWTEEEVKWGGSD